MNPIRFVILLLICLTASPGFTQDWYQIEVIIFEHKNATDDSEDSERWPRDLELAWPSPLIELEPAVSRTEPIDILPPFEELVFDQRKMNNDSYALRVRAPYDLLWHKAWKAPLLPEEQAPWIQVKASDQIGDHHRLEGAIRIHLSRYLHLSTNLWLTEVSGNALTIEDSFNEAFNEVPNSSTSNTAKPEPAINTTEAQSEFDWSQLPEPKTVRWGCNHIRELWPEDDRLLPADYYEDPAPADWYYPFGCRIPSENIERDLPYSVSMPTSNFDTEAELKKNHPELFIESEADSTLGLEVINPSTQIDTLTDTNDLLSRIEVSFLEEAGLPEDLEQELIAPAAKIQYPVKEIIHIKGKRRMRSGEFHYIDHPKIGVLALIHPVEKPELILKPDPGTESEINLESEFQTSSESTE